MSKKEHCYILLPFWTRVWLFFRHYLVKLHILKPIDWYWRELPGMAIGNLRSVNYPGKPKHAWSTCDEIVNKNAKYHED